MHTAAGYGASKRQRTKHKQKIAELQLMCGTRHIYTYAWH